MDWKSTHIHLRTADQAADRACCAAIGIISERFPLDVSKTLPLALFPFLVLFPLGVSGRFSGEISPKAQN